MKILARYSAAIICLSCSVLSVQAEQLPFSNTQDLYVIDSKSGILRITPNKNISVFLSIGQIESVIGTGNSGLSDNGIAFDATGNMYFADNDSILKYTKSNSSLSVLATEASIEAAQGFAVGSGSTDVDAISVGSNGSLFVTDDKSNAVLKINSNSGAVSVHTSQADFLAQTGLTANLDQGIVTGANGSVFVSSSAGGSATVDNGDAIFQIDANGNSSIFVNQDQIADADQFMTTDANGNLIVASDEGETERIYKVSILDGTVSELISTQALESLLSDTPADVDVRGGLAYDDQGNLYVGDSDEDGILRFDSNLNGELWVSKADIMAVTGQTNVSLAAGFAFAPVPLPAAVWFFASGLIGLIGIRKKSKITSA